MKSYAPYVAIPIALAIGLGVWGFVVLTLDTSDPVFSRDIIEYEVVSEEEGVVRYAYKGETLPLKIVEDENVALRTESSYTRKIGNGPEGAIFEARIYSGKAYVQDDDGWHYRETATTTSETITALQWRNPLAMLFVPKVYAADVYAGAGDGYVYKNTATTDWEGMVIDTLGSAQSTTDSVLEAFTEFCPNDGGVDYCVEDRIGIGRSFLPFITSSIPAQAIISAATLNLYTNSKTNTHNDGVDYITVVQTNQASHTALSSTDYDAAGGINATEGIDSGQRKDITSVSLNTYLSFTLNSTGRGWIKKSGQTSNCGVTAGITCLGIREGHDITNTSMVGGGYAANKLMVRSSNMTGTSEDPYLSITYTAPVILTTDAASNLAPTSATLNATISDNGGSDATTCGFAWGTNSSLAGGDTATTTDSTCPSGTGSFTKNISGLDESTAYYFRAYATNVPGTGYGSIQTFTTQDPPPPEMRIKGNTRFQGSRLLGL